MDKKDLLLFQYRLVEERRNYLGNIFWRLPGFFVAVYAIVVAIISREGRLPDLRPVSAVGGCVFLLLAWIAHRFRKQQDECEENISKIEAQLASEFDCKLVTFPRGAGVVGARTATTVALGLFAVLLLILALV